MDFVSLFVYCVSHLYLFFLIIRPPPSSTRTYTLFPHPTHYRSPSLARNPGNACRCGLPATSPTRAQKPARDAWLFPSARPRPTDQISFCHPVIKKRNHGSKPCLGQF